MRTTLVIHDELYKEVKNLAAGRRTSVSQVVNDALRRELRAPATDAPPLRISIPVYGGTELPTTDTTPAELDALLQEEEEKR